MNKKTKEIVIVFQNDGKVRYLSKITKNTMLDINKWILILIELFRSYNILDSSNQYQFIKLPIGMGKNHKLRTIKVRYDNTITLDNNSTYIVFYITNPINSKILYKLHIHKNYVTKIVNWIREKNYKKELISQTKAIVDTHSILQNFDSRYEETAPSLRYEHLVELLKTSYIQVKIGNNSIYYFNTLFTKDSILSNHFYYTNKDGSILYQYKKIIVKKYNKSGLSIKFLCDNNVMLRVILTDRICRSIKKDIGI